MPKFIIFHIHFYLNISFIGYNLNIIAENTPYYNP